MMAATDTFIIRKASKERAKARILVTGPAGSGKTWTSLHIAAALGGSTVIIDTEAGTSNKYASIIDEFVFDVIELGAPYDPDRYVAAMKFCEDEGYENIIIDSLTHAWNGTGGALDQVNLASQKFGGNSHYAWAAVTPKHNKLFQGILQSTANVIGTMRTKVEYTKQEVNGRQTYKKTGTKVIQREETDYEFDVVLRMDVAHNGFVEKTRIPELDGLDIMKPGLEFGNKIKMLLSDGSDELGEVVAQAKVFAHTKVGLIEWAAETHNVDQFAVRDALADAGVEFEPENWDALTKAIADYVVAQNAA